MNGASPEQIATKPFVYEVADFRALNRQVLRWWALLPSVVILGWLVWFFSTLMVEQGFDWLLAGILTVIVVAASGPWTWRPFIMHRTLRRQGLLASQTFVIEPDYIVTHSERGDGRWRWSAVRKIKRVGDRLYIFTAKSVALIIPRRAFDSDQKYEAFAAAARERWEHSRL
jgi:hypothetical protein